MSATGVVELHPTPEALLEPGDRLVVVAHDAEAAARLGRDALASMSIRALDRPEFHATTATQHVLIIGWNGLGRPLLAGWATSADKGSTVEVVFDPRVIDVGDIDAPDLDGITLVLTPIADDDGAVSKRANAENTAIVMLAYRDHLPVQEVDSRTLLELMTLRRDLGDRGLPMPRLVIELTDPANARLAKVRATDEVIITTSMASRIVAQLADDPTRRAVYLALYSTDGPSIHLVPADRLDLRGDVTMSDIVAAAYDRGLLAVGWRRPDDLGGELVLAAPPDRRLAVAAGDMIVVVG